MNVVKSPKHENTGACAKCQQILDDHGGAHKEIRAWFEEFQAAHPEAHCSEAARDRIKQQEVFQRGASRAKFGQSAHNYGCAIDLFVLLPGEKNIYPVKWFTQVLAPNLPPWLTWYGSPGAKFFELPHVELKTWRTLVKNGLVKLVE